MAGLGHLTFTHALLLYCVLNFIRLLFGIEQLYLCTGDRKPTKFCKEVKMNFKFSNDRQSCKVYSLKIPSCESGGPIGAFLFGLWRDVTSQFVPNYLYCDWTFMHSPHFERWVDDWNILVPCCVFLDCSSTSRVWGQLRVLLPFMEWSVCEENQHFFENAGLNSGTYSNLVSIVVGLPTPLTRDERASGSWDACAFGVRPVDDILLSPVPTIQSLNCVQDPDQCNRTSANLTRAARFTCTGLVALVWFGCANLVDLGWLFKTYKPHARWFVLQVCFYFSYFCDHIALNSKHPDRLIQVCTNVKKDTAILFENLCTYIWHLESHIPQSKVVNNFVQNSGPLVLFAGCRKFVAFSWRRQR